MNRRPKGLLRVDGVPLTSRIAKLLEGFCERVYLVGDPFGPYADLGWPVVSDLRRGKGAPGGVHAALSHADPGWVFVAACDLPGLDAEAIQTLADARGAHDVVLYQDEAGPQPLAAWWHTRALRAIEPLLPRNPGFGLILEELDVLALEPANPAVLRNVNTWEEAEALNLSFGARPAAARRM